MYQNGFFPSGYSNMAAGQGVNNLMFGNGVGAKAGLLSKLTGGIGKFNFGSFLTTTQKTLGVINQAIPVFNQVRPMFNNAKTMFKVMGALKDDGVLESNTSVVQQAPENVSRSSSSVPIQPLVMGNQPQFFL